MNQSRRRFTAEQKAEIVRRHLAGKEPVSNLADEFGLQRSQIHNWVELVLDQAEKAFQHRPGRPPRVEQAKSRKIEVSQCIEKPEPCLPLPPWATPARLSNCRRVAWFWMPRGYACGTRALKPRRSLTGSEDRTPKAPKIRTPFRSCPSRPEPAEDEPDDRRRWHD